LHGAAVEIDGRNGVVFFRVTSEEVVSIHGEVKALIPGPSPIHGEGRRIFEII
jgi:hypothetical protein